MVHLSRIYTQALKERELQWIAKAVKVSYGEADIKPALRKISRGELELYSISVNNGAGVLAIRWLEDELWVEFIGGNGLMPETKEIFSAVQELAKSAGRKTVGFFVRRRGLEELYKRELGLTPVATLYRKEL